MKTEVFIDPIRRLRAQAADRVTTERGELLDAYKDAVAQDVLLTKNQRDELEEKIAEHNRWLGENTPRLEAVLPRVLPALSVYEQKRDLYRNQIASVLSETAQITANSLFGSRMDGTRDPNAFKDIVAGVKGRLGSCRGLVGALDRQFLQIEVELVALEKRGFGLEQTV